VSKQWSLSDETTQELLGLPETGMGFQFIEGLANGRPVKLLVFNTDLAYDVSDLKLTDSDDPASILLNGTLIVKAISTPETTRGSLSVTGITISPPRVGNPGGGTPGRGLPQGAPPSGDFLAGTYATTDSDFPLAPSGFAAIGRFALPNNLPASHHFQIEAPVGAPVICGTVAPAYGQAGGGVETLFVSAVKNGQVPPVSSRLPDD
jgi:hypothetical protein